MNPLVVIIVKYLMPPVAWLLSLFIPHRSSRIAVREARNKAWIMGLVSPVEKMFPPKGNYLPLPELVDRCYAMGSFPALWAVEGLGNYYAETFRERKLELKNLLTDPALDSLPARSLTMLHAGIGLSFAKRSLEGLSHRSPATQLREALERFVQLCTNSSRRGYRGAAFESLGLVTLILHSPEMASALDRELAAIEPEAASFMWRGAGRALYFHPRNFIPGFRCPWRGFEMSRRIAPHEMARRNLYAGIAWAMTVVNMRDPEVMESALLYQGPADPDRDVFVNGIMSAIIMRYDTSPEDPNIKSFVEHRPDAGNSLLCRLWNDVVRVPSETAINVIYPVLVQNRRLEEVFHFRSLQDLCSELSSGR
jgi:hypothetical protein